MEQAIPTDAELLEQIERFCNRHDLKPSTFGRMAVSDPSFIPNLKSGRSPSLKMAGRIASFMATYGAGHSQVAA